MSTPKNIWSDLPLSAGIATFVCYAGVFNDVIGIEEMAARLGHSTGTEFLRILNQLESGGRLILRDGFAGLPDLQDRISVKATKIATARSMINSRLASLKSMGRNPLVKFVGVSGSLAAGNPTKDHNNMVDLDVFIITRNQCLWLYNIWRGLLNLFPEGNSQPPLCLSYIMDESDSLIANRNFYTATEAKNLIPIAGLDAYRKFIQINNWVDRYYPGTSGGASQHSSAPTHCINKFFYAAYNGLRKIKWCLKTDPHKKLSSHRGINFNVLSPHGGGYQAMVQKKFSRLAEKWFPDLLDADLIKRLFPDQLSAEIRSGELDMAAMVQHVGLGYDYSKYA